MMKKLVKICMIISSIICLALMSWSCKDQHRSTEETFKAVELAYSHEFNGISFNIRSMDFSGNKRIMCNSFGSKAEPVLLFANSTGEVDSIRYGNFYNSQNFDTDKVKKLCPIFCTLKIYGQGCDEFGNIYIRIKDEERYEYVFVRNQKNLKKRYTYIPINDNWFKMQW